MQNKNYGWPTARCFPRTTNKAFPNDVANAQWWYPPEQRWQDKVLFAIGVFGGGALALYFWRTA